MSNMLNTFWKDSGACRSVGTGGWADTDEEDSTPDLSGSFCRCYHVVTGPDSRMDGGDLICGAKEVSWNLYDIIRMKVITEKYSFIEWRLRVFWGFRLRRVLA